MYFGLERFDTVDAWLNMLNDVDVQCEVDGVKAVTFHEVKQRMFKTITAEDRVDIVELNRKADDEILDFIDANADLVKLHSARPEDYYPRQEAFNASQQEGMMYVICEQLD